ncbi:NAD(P)-binding protein, partial [Rhizobium ruizarguesonis]
MLFPLESAIKADAETVAASDDYDSVIVGSGISGAISAKQAAEAGKRVLIVEAGTG